MIDIVYILGNGSKWNNNELRYSLRSLEKFMTWYRHIYVIGEKPAFLSDKIIHIPAEDRGRNKEECIMNKIMIACETLEVSENFLLMNDDYFFLQPTRSEFPFYYEKDLSEFYKRGGHYRIAIDNTIRVLKENNLPTKYYDVHVPIIYNKSLFVQVMNKYDWSVPDGYVIRSLYCNTLKLDGVPWTDCKVASDCDYEMLLEMVSNKPLFTIDDGAINDALFGYLDNILSTHCIYETGVDRPSSINILT